MTSLNFKNPIQRERESLEFYLSLHDIFAQRSVDVLSSSDNKTIGKDILFWVHGNMRVSYDAMKSYDGQHFEMNTFDLTSLNIDFHIARLLFHFFKVHRPSWKVCFKKNVGGVVPDIRIVDTAEEKIVAIINLLSKEWLYPFATSESFKEKLPKPDVETLIAQTKEALEQSVRELKISTEDFYLILPTYYLIDKRDGKTFEEQRAYFADKVGMSVGNLILLSKNRSLSSEEIKESLLPTEDFNKMIDKLLIK